MTFREGTLSTNVIVLRRATDIMQNGDRGRTAIYSTEPHGLASFDVHQSLEHYNALMYDGHVERPAMNDRTMNMWLWDHEHWPRETVLD